MAKQRITKKAKKGTFIRLSDDFKKKAQIFAINNGYTLTSLIVEAVEEKMKG